jgi:hypothetical protein
MSHMTLEYAEIKDRSLKSGNMQYANFSDNDYEQNIN